jgi:hypothetical protein
MSFNPATTPGQPSHTTRPWVTSYAVAICHAPSCRHIGGPVVVLVSRRSKSIDETGVTSRARRQPPVKGSGCFAISPAILGLGSGRKDNVRPTFPPDQDTHARLQDVSSLPAAAMIRFGKWPRWAVARDVTAVFLRSHHDRQSVFKRGPVPDQVPQAWRTGVPTARQPLGRDGSMSTFLVAQPEATQPAGMPRRPGTCPDAGHKAPCAQFFAPLRCFIRQA